MPDKRVAQKLEGQRRQRRLIRAGPLHHVALGVQPLYRGDIQGRRQVGHHRVQERLHPFVLEGRAAQYRHDLQGNGAPPERRLDQAVLHRFVGQVALHDALIHFGQDLQNLGAGLGHLLGVSLGDLPDLKVHALANIVIIEGFQVDEVDHPLEFVFFPDGKLQEHRSGLEALPHHLQAPGQVRAHPVHLVDEGQPGDAVAVGLAPHRLRLGLHPAHRIENRHHPVQHPEAALHFNGKVHVPRRVDDVDAMVLPVAGGGGRGDGDAAFLFLDHPVHRGLAVVHFAQAVRHSRVEEDTLRGGGFTGVDVGHKPNIPYPVQRGLSRQISSLVFRSSFFVLRFAVAFGFPPKTAKRKTLNGILTIYSEQRPC